MLVATEVANVKHVYEALKYGVDIIWIGARTSGNPFAVQDIADSLRGGNIPVMVKNPINPDVDLWIGAIERINNAGISHALAKTADVDSEQALMTIQVDLMGVFYGMKHQIRAMELAYRQHKRTASILNLASLAGIGGAPTLSMYSAAKHGVVGL